MRKLLFLALTAGLLLAGATLGNAAEALTPAQKAAVETLIHDTLMEHPEIIVEAVQSYRARQESAGRAAGQAALVGVRDQALNDPDSPVSGNPAGDVTVVEFFDYRCPYCKTMREALTEVIRGDGKIRFVYKEFPVLGANSVYAAKAALAARAQGKYEEFHAALMRAPGRLEPDAVRKVAAETGLDVKRLVADIEQPAIEAMLDKNMHLAEQLQLHGTPAFIIGDEIIPGAVSAAQLREMVAAARSKGDKK